MKKNVFLVQIAAVAMISVFVFSGAVAQNGVDKTYKYADTIPGKKAPKDIDDALIKIEISKAEVEKALKEIDWEKINREIKASMSTMKVDMAEMKKDLEKAMKEIDASKIQASVNQALKEIDTEKMKKELQAAVAKIDAEKINREIRKVTEEELPKVQEELRKMKPAIEKSIQEARISLEEARKELTAYKGFISNLEKEGLLNQQEAYSIEYKSGELFVNGKKVNAETQHKYDDFLKEKKDFKIQKDKDGFDIKH